MVAIVLTGLRCESAEAEFLKANRYYRYKTPKFSKNQEAISKF